MVIKLYIAGDGVADVWKKPKGCLLHVANESSFVQLFVIFLTWSTSPSATKKLSRKTFVIHLF